MDSRKGRLGHISSDDSSEDQYAMEEGDIRSNGDKTATRVMTRREARISTLLLKNVIVMQENMQKVFKCNVDNAVGYLRKKGEQ